MMKFFIHLIAESQAGTWLSAARESWADVLEAKELLQEVQKAMATHQTT
jgi:hypothetical protein